MPRYLVNIEGHEYDIELKYRSEKYYASLSGREVEVSLHELGESRALLLIDGNCYEVDVRSNGYDRKKVVFMKGMEIVTEVEDFNLATLRKTAGIDTDASVDRMLTASMPGMVVDVKVAPGDKVNSGQTVLVIEAMKMENIIKAHGDGVVREVYARTGISVEKGDKLVEFE